MTPTCLFCGTLDLIARECPTCGGKVYDVEQPADRRLVEDYKSWVVDGGRRAAIGALAYLPVVGGFLSSIAQLLAHRRIARELRKRFTDEPARPIPHDSPYR